MGATNRPQIIFVLGCPASGKSTHSRVIARDTGFYHVSIGDYLRDLANPMKVHSEEAFGGMEFPTLRWHIHEHKLLPPESVVKILLHKIEHEQNRGVTSFLIDGFPRDEASAALFERLWRRPDEVYLFNCPKALAAERFKSRNRDKARSDEIFEERFEEFEKNNPALVTIYEGYGILKVYDTTNIDDVRFIKRISSV